MMRTRALQASTAVAAMLLTVGVAGAQAPATPGPLTLAVPPAAPLVAITNATETDWQGTVALSVDGAAVPVAIGAIDAGDTGVDDVELRVRSGQDYEITGTLLIGP